MRKVLSLVLVLALVLSSFSMAFADDTAAATTATTTTATALSDVEGLACEQAVKVLVDLGVVTGYADGTYKPAATVTRAEAAVIVIKMLGLEKSVGTQKSSYTDMAGYGWAEPYIAFASNLGILQGDGNGLYRPGDVVSYNEFAKIMVAALGYTADSLTGTWPGNYVNKAMGLDIMKDVVSGGAAGATRGDVAIMVNNNLTNYIGTIDKDGNFQKTVIKDAANDDDKVYDSPVYRLGGTKEEAVIDDVSGSIIDAREYLGKYCEYYVNDDGEIIAVKNVKSTTLDGTSEDVATPTTFTVDDVDYNLPELLRFDEDGDSDIDDPAHRFNNSKLLTASNAQLAQDTDYVLEVRLNGKTIKEVYSVSMWSVTDAAKVAAGDLDDIKDAELLGHDFDTNKDGSIDTKSFELIGVAKLDDIKADNVVYVYTEDNDANKNIRRVAVGTEVVEGTITKENKTDSEWTVNGKTYGMATNPKTGFNNGNVNNDVKLFLDAYGDIYDYDITSGSADDYAVVKDNAGSYNGIKLYLADTTTKVFDTDVTEDVSATYANGTLVGYSLDKDGVIDKFEGPSHTSSVAFVNNKQMAVTAGGAYTTVKIDSDVVVFTVNGVGTTTDLDVSKIADVDKWDTSKASATQFHDTVVLLNSDGDVVAVIVDEDYVTGASEDQYAVIDSVSAAAPNGDKVQQLTGFIDGTKMGDVYTSGKSTADDALTDVEAGTVNVYKIKYNAEGEISNIKSVAANGGTVIGNATTAYAYGAAGLQYVADGVLKVAATTSLGAVTTYALADDVVVYGVEFDNGDIDEYSKYSGSIKAGTQLWLFNVDDDDNEYDIVIVAK